jgi:hypothetical protein
MTDGKQQSASAIKLLDDTRATRRATNCLDFCPWGWRRGHVLDALAGGEQCGGGGSIASAVAQKRERGGSARYL